ncbi:hypothetical protein GQ651_12805 [Alphaproteobacteria bacterium GH1-50]|uniref:Uncharacterized protein n=1 Tax=Kangsaoukella pontilimi TaxID=2691042 RepID=A0A7C9IHJ0_9RHOB|nr:hypothetical protein [Kangsaoukella pontilimi]MXQ08729.1 hypothetical protein [Kangsaoukella pontilimi]
MKRYFPEEAALWRERMGDLVLERRKGIYNTTAPLAVGADIRSRNAPYLANAPDALLVEVLEQQHALLALYSADREACGRLALEGPAGLSAVERRKMAPVVNETTVLYQAMHAGKTNPVSRGPSTDLDWEAFFQDMRAAGFSDADIELMIAPDPANPRYCDTILGFLKTLTVMEFDGADRIRAEMAVAMLGS